MERLLERYRHRHGLLARGELVAPCAQELRMIVVIPARGENDIDGVLASLAACERPCGATEVLVVVNASEGDSPLVLEANAATVRAVAAWEAQNLPGLRFHSISDNRIAARRAGVGTARKRGMDEAALRLLRVNAEDGVIVCLDADCRVTSNYLTAIQQHFVTHMPAAAVLYYEHPLPEDPFARQAIVRYEMHLRAYVNGLRAAGSPFRSHTLGSCIAITARCYVELGGMNRRQAGEDFYFVNKISQRFEVSELCTTCVYPEARISGRVPFGTGRAMGIAVAGLPISSYDPRCYTILASVLSALEMSELNQPSRLALFGIARPYMEGLDWFSQVAKAIQHTASADAYRKRIRVWFDGFQAMKMIHWLTEHYYPKVEVLEAASCVFEFATGRSLSCAGNSNHQELLALEAFRRLDRSRDSG